MLPSLIFPSNTLYMFCWSPEAWRRQLHSAPTAYHFIALSVSTARVISFLYDFRVTLPRTLPHSRSFFDPSSHHPLCGVRSTVEALRWVYVEVMW